MDHRVRLTRELKEEGGGGFQGWGVADTAGNQQRAQTRQEAVRVSACAWCDDDATHARPSKESERWIEEYA